MARKERKDTSKLRELMNEYGVKTMEDVHNFVKMLTAETIQAALDAELESELGYSKYDYKNKETDNSRNGYSSKTVQGSLGEMEINVPRDRNGEFEPQLVKKHQTDVSAIEDKVIFLYSQGVSTRDIQKTMREMYGIEVDDSRVSKITDKLLPMLREWQERPLQSVYAMIILDAVHYSVRENGIVTKKAAYVAIGTDYRENTPIGLKGRESKHRYSPKRALQNQRGEKSNGNAKRTRFVNIGRLLNRLPNNVIGYGNAKLGELLDMRVNLLVAVEPIVVLRTKVFELMAGEYKENSNGHRMCDCHCGPVSAAM